MIIKALSTLFILISLSACVTTHPGVMSNSSDKSSSLLVSVDEDSSISDKYYAFLEYTFENTSTDWIKVKVARLGFENSTTEILVNDRLSSWLEGVELKLKKNQHNTAVILGSVAAVGGIAAATSSNGNIQVAGLGAMVGVTGAAVAIDVGNARRRAQSGEKGLNQTVNVPKTHVFVPFEVAPGSYVKRWVVVRKPKDFKSIRYGADDTNLITELDQNKVEVSYKTKL